MNSPVLDLATLPATPQQRRAALVAIVSLGVLGLIAAPFSRNVIGTFPGFVTLYGGAVLMGLAVTAMILFAQFSLSRKPSLLFLACGTTFSTLVFIPYLLTFPGVGTPRLFGADETTGTYLWALWHSVLPASYIGYVLIAMIEGTQRVRPARTAACVVLTFMAAGALSQFIYVYHDRLAKLAPLTHEGHYLTPLYIVLGVIAALSAVAFLMLIIRTRTVIDAWLSVPATAFLLESVLNIFGGVEYSVGWYLSRADVLIATAFLVITLLYETNRLARGLSHSEQRLSGLISGVADALIIVDSRGLVTSVNPAAASLFGFDAQELAGTPLSRLLPEYELVTPLYANVVETTGRDRAGNMFPIEFARGATRDLGEAVIIVRDITQRKRAEEAIHAAHDRAVEAAQVKAQFLATMSHEIRTPINAVVGMSELLLQTSLDDEGREYAVTVRDSAESLLGIVNDILDFSKIEAGRMDLEAVPFSPVVAVENATDILAAAARKKGLSLSTYVAPDVPRRVVGDADRLRQILLNLLGNAVKFTASGSVTVRAVVEHLEGAQAVLRFSVTDTGPGIAAEAAGQLFEPFRQADQSTRRRFGGTGLGLSISRRIVELMGGNIGFDSTVGRGSTFWFTVPFPRVVEEQHDPVDLLRGARVLIVDEEAVARQVVDQYLLAWGAIASSTGNAAHALELARAMASRRSPFDAVIIDRAAGGDGYAFAARLRAVPGLEKVGMVLVTGSDEPSGGPEARAHGFVTIVRKPIRQLTLHDALVSAVHGVVPAEPRLVETRDATPRPSVLVLIAEDNPVNRKLALQQLKKLGYAAHAVPDGREAIDAVARDDYDLVLMDCQMPEVDGFEATREIRRAEAARGRHVPIIAMTANALEGDREQCLAAGMDDYLAKPVQLASLRAVIERFVHGIGVAG